MTMLVENPVLALAIAIIAAAVFGGLFISTRRGVFLVGVGAAVLVALVGVAVERLVVTERERVEMTLDQLAAALAWDTPDLDAKTARVMEFLSPSAVKTRARAEWALSRFTVTGASVRNLEITMNDLTSPPSAECKFDGLITIADRQGYIPGRAYPVHFTAKLRKEGDRWLVAEHTDAPPHFGRHGRD